MTDFFSEAEERYREAVTRRDAIRDAWQEQAGGHLLAKGSTGQLVEHPLVKMLREHDMLVARLAEAVERAGRGGGRHRGPVPSAVISPPIGRSPAAKLRRVQ